MGNLGLPAKPVIVKTDAPPLAEKIAEKAVETIHRDATPAPKTKAGRPPKAFAAPPVAAAKKAVKSAPKPASIVEKRPKAAKKAPFSSSRFAELPAEPSGDVRKISLDLPTEWFKAIKFHCVEHDITMREFLMDVISRDLKKRGAA